jgi:hypothetical protein
MEMDAEVVASSAQAKPMSDNVDLSQYVCPGQRLGHEDDFLSGEVIIEKK